MNRLIPCENLSERAGTVSWPAFRLDFMTETGPIPNPADTDAEMGGKLVERGALDVEKICTLPCVLLIFT